MKANGFDIIAQDCPQEMAQLKRLMQLASDVFLKNIGVDDATILQRDRANIHIWATAHEHCTTHSPHCHAGELVSGVYYVTLPKESGSISFDDPRGPLPPFDNREVIHPSEGQMILFPSWLMHAVSPTSGRCFFLSPPTSFDCYCS